MKKLAENNALDSNKLIALFRKYGFDYKKHASGVGFYAFTFKTGFFHNAELVYTKDANFEDMEKSINSLVDIGYSTKKSPFESLDDIEKNLFNGFFNVDDWKERIETEYDIHCKKMLSILPSGAENYTYVHVPYEKDSDNKNNDEDIIINIHKEILDKKSAKLILIEAPAGFGKTCTSYEILNNLIKIEGSPLPFFTEFSRDRQAKVFSHVFVREVDRSFRTVKSDLVIDETKNGKIVLVLDGFDELLNETSTTNNNDIDFEKAQPMLETIGELLTNSAKVILTSRRTAIFDGEVFQEWKDKYKNSFQVIRYRLSTPEVKDWLPTERIDKIKIQNIDIKKLSNPVLLAYLRSVDDSKFNSLCENASRIVEHYFESMLDREKERQDLLMTSDSQSHILSMVALDMCENDYTSDEKDKIIDLIKEKCGKILEDTRILYPGKDRPTVEALANKLATHAFFDRSNQGENRIEFVNEFVFGNFISKGIIDNDDNDSWLAADERFVDPAVQSYLPRNEGDREILWDKLSGMREFLTSSDHMKYESLLLQKVGSNAYTDTTITGLSFENIEFFKDDIISNSVFNECTFSNSTFNMSNFFDVTFISCQFYNCTYDEKQSSFDISFLNCSDNNDIISKIELLENSKDILDINIELSLEREILNKYMPLGSTSITRLHVYTGVLYKIDSFSRKDITKAIKRLKEKGILESANSSSFTAINKNCIGEVKKILGR